MSLIRTADPNHLHISQAEYDRVLADAGEKWAFLLNFVVGALRRQGGCLHPGQLGQAFEDQFNVKAKEYLGLGKKQNYLEQLESRCGCDNYLQFTAEVVYLTEGTETRAPASQTSATRSHRATQSMDDYWSGAASPAAAADFSEQKPAFASSTSVSLYTAVSDDDQPVLELTREEQSRLRSKGGMMLDVVDFIVQRLASQPDMCADFSTVGTSFSIKYGRTLRKALRAGKAQNIVDYIRARGCHYLSMQGCFLSLDPDAPQLCAVQPPQDTQPPNASGAGSRFRRASSGVQPTKPPGAGIRRAPSHFSGHFGSSGVQAPRAPGGRRGFAAHGTAPAAASGPVPDTAAPGAASSDEYTITAIRTHDALGRLVESWDALSTEQTWPVQFIVPLFTMSSSHAWVVHWILLHTSCACGEKGESMFALDVDALRGSVSGRQLLQQLLVKQPVLRIGYNAMAQCVGERSLAQTLQECVADGSGAAAAAAAASDHGSVCCWDLSVHRRRSSQLSGDSVAYADVQATLQCLADHGQPTMGRASKAFAHWSDCFEPGSSAAHSAAAVALLSTAMANVRTGAAAAVQAGEMGASVLNDAFARPGHVLAGGALEGGGQQLLQQAQVAALLAYYMRCAMSRA